MFSPAYWNNLSPQQQEQFNPEIVRQGVGGGYFNSWLDGTLEQKYPDKAERVNRKIFNILSGQGGPTHANRDPNDPNSRWLWTGRGPQGDTRRPGPGTWTDPNDPTTIGPSNRPPVVGGEGGTNYLSEVTPGALANPDLFRQLQTTVGTAGHDPRNVSGSDPRNIVGSGLGQEDYFTGAETGLNNLKGISELERLAQTGGVTDEYRNLLRARTNAPVSSAHESILRNQGLNQARGGYQVPGQSGAQDFQSNRDHLAAIGRTNLDTELALFDRMMNQSSSAARDLGSLDLARLQSLAGIGGQRQERDFGIFDRGEQSRQFNVDRLEDARQFNVNNFERTRDRETGVREAGADRNQNDRQFLANLGLTGSLGFEGLRNQRLNTQANLFGGHQSQDLAALLGLGDQGLKNKQLDILRDDDGFDWEGLLKTGLGSLLLGGLG